MISYEALLQAMTQQVEQAKHAASEQQLREQLTAVKALCDVVLGNTSVTKSSSQPLAFAQTPTTPLQTTAYTPQSPISIQSTNKLQEQDANGDSIFDF